MYYKLDVLQPTWKGVFDDFGFHLMSSLPNGAPLMIPPTPIVDTEFVDLKHFHQFISQDAINEWSKFQAEQFADGDHLHDYDDFWCQNFEDHLSVDSDSQTDIFDNIERIIPDSPISIPDHPTLVSRQLQIGKFIAFTIEDDDTPFYIGCVQSTENDILKLQTCTFNEQSLLVTISDNLLVVPVSRLMHVPFNLTKQHKLRKPTFKKLNELS
jgi:hypothetical protein